LQNHGDKLEVARDIDHWVYFADVLDRDAFVVAASERGFAVRSLSESPSSDDRRYCVQLWRSDTPSFDAIDDIAMPLFDLAIKHNGDYDGWESIVVK
jgi:regulator of RNase E activity RraB